MIFVTVGTHEQQFDRLISYIDELKHCGDIEEDVFMQTGYCDYEPKYCQWKSLITYDEMVKKVEGARIVITHGGPSSFIMPLQIGKIPVVVPRQKRFGEHVNDHQVEFVRMITERLGNIIGVYDVGELKKLIREYDNMVKMMPKEMINNNMRFNKEIERIIEVM